MPSLQSCLIHATKALSDDEVAEVKALYRQYIKEGIPKAEAAMEAINDMEARFLKEREAAIKEAKIEAPPPVPKDEARVSPNMLKTASVLLSDINSELRPKWERRFIDRDLPTANVMRFSPWARDSVATAMEDVRAAGVPDYAFDSVKAFGEFGKDFPWSFQAAYNPGINIVAFRSDTIPDETSSDEAKLGFRINLTHEMGHAIDFKGTLMPYSIASPLFKFSLNDEGVIEMGPVIGEFVELWAQDIAERDGQDGVGELLGYPFNRIASFAETNDILDQQFIQKEAFAQLYALWYNNNSLVRKYMPEATKFMEAIHDATGSEKFATDYEKDRAVRRAFRVEGPTRSIVMARVSGPAGLGVEREQAGEGVPGVQGATGERGRHVPVIERGVREIGRGVISADEYKIINAFVKKDPTTPRDVIAKAIRNYKALFPVGKGWARLKVSAIKPTAKGFKVEYKKIPYNYHTVPQKDGTYKIVNATREKRINQFADKIVQEIKSIQTRAKKGDLVAQHIMDGAYWYISMRTLLRDVFGGFGDTLVDLLGPFSARTNVKVNWQRAITALRKMSHGEYDKALSALQDHLRNGGTIDNYKGPMIFSKKEGGPGFGLGDKQAMLAMLNMWRQIKPGQPPKTRNFALNLLGLSDNATIDDWAGRTMQRIANEIWPGKFPRVPPGATAGISGTYRKNAPQAGGAYGFAVDVFREAADKLGMQPHQVQAIEWLAEKELWTKNGWTRESGGDFREELLSQPRRRLIAGVTTDQGKPTPDVILDKTADYLAQSLNGDPHVEDYRVMPTVGLYAGEMERSLDLELVTDLEYDPVDLVNDVATIGKEADQYDVFVNEVILNKDETSDNFRPGIEIYFPDPESFESAKPMMDDIVKRGVDGFTMIVDPRAQYDDNLSRLVEDHPQWRETGKFVGVRMLYVPEFGLRWDEEFREAAKKNPNVVVQKMNEVAKIFGDLSHDLVEKGYALIARPTMNKTLVIGKENYDDFIWREKDDARAARRVVSGRIKETWSRQSIRQAISSAIRRLENVQLPAEEEAVVRKLSGEEEVIEHGPRGPPEYSVTPQGEIRKAGLTPKAHDNLGAIAKDITDIVRNLTEGRVNLRLEDRIKVTHLEAAAEAGRAEAETAAGYYDQVENLIAIALSDNLYDPYSTALHEVWHWVEAQGLLTPAEIRALERSEPALQALAAQALGVPVDDPSIQRMSRHEIRAVAFQEWGRGRLKAGPTRTESLIVQAFRKVQTLFRKLAQRLHLKGLTFEDVFDATLSGGMALRASNPARFVREVSLQYSLVPHPDMWQWLHHNNMRLWDRVRRATSKEALNATLDWFRKGIQDRYLGLLRLQQAAEEALGRPLREDEMPYGREERYTSSTGAILKDIDEIQEEILRSLVENGISLEDFELYLIALHAPERNARIRRLDPDYAAKGGGIGMSDEDAAEIRKKVESGPKAAVFKRLALRVQDVVKMDRYNRWKGGLRSDKETAALDSMYEWYVPAKGWQEAEELSDDPELRKKFEIMAQQHPHMGQGYSIGGKEHLPAKGRVTMPGNILANVFTQAREGAIRAGKNHVLQALHNLVEELLQSDAIDAHKAFSIDVPEERYKYQKESGIIYKATVEEASWNEDHIVKVKIDGRVHRIIFKMDHQTPRALKNMSVDTGNALMSTLGAINRFLSSMFTMLSPPFVVTNFFRDIQTALINLNEIQGDYNIEHLKRNVMIDVFSGRAIRGAHRGLRRVSKPAKSKSAVEWQEWMDRLERAGGKVNFFKIDNLFENVHDINNTMREIQAIIDLKKGRLTTKDLAPLVRKGSRSVLEMIENGNMAIENGVRLATFRRLVEGGVPEEQAASITKNLTVNFNRRGDWSVFANSLFLFFNASVQGVARLMQAVVKSKTVRAIFAGQFLFGITMDLINAAMSPGDDDDDPTYDKISDYMLGRYMILPFDWTGTKKGYTSIPLPYGYSLLYAYGGAISRWLRGARDGVDTLTALWQYTVNNMSPIETVVPTFVSPFVEIATNKNHWGAPIMPSSFGNEPEDPDFLRYFPSVNPLAQKLSYLLNRASGGTPYSSGLIDISPESIEHVFTFFTGGLGEFTSKYLMGGVLRKPSEGLDLHISDLPVVSRVVRHIDPMQERSIAYARIGEIEEGIEESKRLEELIVETKDPSERRRYMQRRHDYDFEKAMLPIARGTRNQLSAINKQRQAIKEEGGKKQKDRLRQLIKQQQQIVDQFNKQWFKLRQQYRKPPFVNMFSEVHAQERIGNAAWALRQGDEVWNQVVGPRTSLSIDESMQAAKASDAPAVAAILGSLPSDAGVRLMGYEVPD